MTVNILAFGIAKEILGNRMNSMPFITGLSVEGLKGELEQRYPRLQELTSFMIAVNGEYAGAGIVIKPGDEIAIIPPVSGG